jgi:hypothetical protein
MRRIVTTERHVKRHVDRQVSKSRGLACGDAARSSSGTDIT